MNERLDRPAEQGAAAPRNRPATLGSWIRFVLARLFDILGFIW